MESGESGQSIVVQSTSESVKENSKFFYYVTYMYNLGSNGISYGGRVVGTSEPLTKGTIMAEVLTTLKSIHQTESDFILMLIYPLPDQRE